MCAVPSAPGVAGSECRYVMSRDGATHEAIAAGGRSCCLEAAGQPFAVGRGLDAGPGPEDGAEALGIGPDALDDLASLGEDGDLAIPSGTLSP